MSLHGYCGSFISYEWHVYAQLLVLSLCDGCLVD